MNEIKVGTIIRLFNAKVLCISPEDKHRNVNWLGKITEQIDEWSYAFNFLQGSCKLGHDKKPIKWFISISRFEDGTAEVVL